MLSFFVYLISDDSRKQITVLAAGCADGTMLAPLILYNSKALLAKWFDNTDEIHIDRTESGYMDAHTFFSYFAKVVLKYLEEVPRNPGEPKVFIHASS